MHRRPGNGDVSCTVPVEHSNSKQLVPVRYHDPRCTTLVQSLSVKNPHCAASQHRANVNSHMPVNQLHSRPSSLHHFVPSGFSRNLVKVRGPCVKRIDLEDNDDGVAAAKKTKRQINYYIERQMMRD